MNPELSQLDFIICRYIFRFSVNLYESIYLNVVLAMSYYTGYLKQKIFEVAYLNTLFVMYGTKNPGVF